MLGYDRLKHMKHIVCALPVLLALSLPAILLPTTSGAATTHETKPAISELEPAEPDLGDYQPAAGDDRTRMRDIIALSEDIEAYHAKTGHYPLATTEPTETETLVFIKKNATVDWSQFHGRPQAELEAALQKELGKNVHLPDDPWAQMQHFLYIYKTNGQDYTVAANLMTAPFYTQPNEAFATLTIGSRPSQTDKILTKKALLFQLKAGKPNADLQKQLLDAAKAKDTAALKAAIDAGADLNPVCGFDQRCQPLAIAAAEGDAATIDFLLAHGADINGFNDYEDVPLNIAMAAGRADAAKKLILAGANVNLPNALGVTPFIGATHGGDIALVKLMLAHGADVNSHFLTHTGDTKPGDRGERPLEAAIRAGHADVAEALLKAGANPKLAGQNGVTMRALADATSNARLVALLKKK